MASAPLHTKMTSNGHYGMMTSNVDPISSDPKQPEYHPTLQRVADFFELQERQSSFRTECLAGLVTFMTMAQILAVNANILIETGGTCTVPDSENGSAQEWDQFYDCLETLKRDIITATAASACITSLLMGFTANMPLGLAPGLGINAYFTYNVVGGWWSADGLSFDVLVVPISHFGHFSVHFSSENMWFPFCVN